MHITAHDEVGEYILTYADGDELEEETLVAITAVEDRSYFCSDDLSPGERDQPLACLERTEYGETLPDYFESKEQVPYKILERLGENAMEETEEFSAEEDLEYDSADPADVRKKLDLLDVGGVSRHLEDGSELQSDTRTA